MITSKTQNTRNSNLKSKDLFNPDRVRITNHVYDNLLLRKGWDERKSEFELKFNKFRKISRYSKILKKYPHVINKFNNYPKSKYYVSEKENLILVVGEDNLNKGGESLITCLFIDDYMISRYKDKYQMY